jgi:N-acetylmuramoyl-L-alanine amidase
MQHHRGGGEMTITESLLTPNPYSRPGTPIGRVQALIMHWTGVPNQPADIVRDFFDNRKNGHQNYGSAHYIVGQGGGVIRCIPETEVAYHVGSSQPDPASGRIYTDWARAQFGDAVCDPATIGPNACTLGIEMCVIDPAGNFTEQTKAASVELAADICARLHLNPFSDVSTHHAVVGWKDCPRLWVMQPALLGTFRAEVASMLAKGNP